MNQIATTKILFAFFVISALSGCMNAAITGAQVAYSHDHLSKTFEDQYITTQANRKLFRDTHDFDDCSIAVATFHQTVLLTGQVSTPQKKATLSQLIQEIPDVQKVYNLTTISGPTAALTHISDTWITTKIKSKLIAMNDVNPDDIKVVTENGTVYLMGIIQPQAADIAVEVARSTDGVQNVVKVFSYLRISNSPYW